MSIHKKTLIIVGIIFLFLISSLIVISELVVMKGFIDLESENMRLNMNRGINEISNIFSQLNSTAKDWAWWDETYMFVEDLNERYIEGNLSNTALVNLKLNFMVFMNTAGQIVYSKWVDLITAEEMPLSSEVLEKISTIPALLNHSGKEKSTAGMIMTAQSPVFLVATPILKNDESGPMRGTLSIGRFLDTTEIQRIAKLTHLALSICPFNDPHMPPDYQAVRSAFADQRQPVVRLLSPEVVAAYALQQDIDGNPAFILKVESARDIYKRGQQTLWYYLGSLIIIGAVFIAVLLVLLKKIVLTPLSRLSHKVNQIRRIDDLSQRIAIVSKDELGDLANAINHMFQQLFESTELSKINQQLAGEIEERKQIEQVLKHAYEIQKNTQAQLIQSAKLASIGELASGVAHELNQPLMVIRTTAQFLQRNLEKGRLSEDQIKTAFGPLDRNTKRMMLIINHLRTFSRQSQSEFAPVDINQIIEGAFLMIGEQLRLHNIMVHKHLATGLPKVLGDANQLEQVFLNLLTNARDAIAATGNTEACTIEIVTQVSRADGECVEILFKDNGMGIAAEHVEKIFDPFFTTKAVGKGTGLGLSISYGIIHDHHGKIAVAGTGPEGTTFMVKLPVEQSTAPQDQS